MQVSAPLPEGVYHLACRGGRAQTLACACGPCHDAVSVGAQSLTASGVLSGLHQALAAYQARPWK